MAASSTFESANLNYLLSTLIFTPLFARFELLALNAPTSATVPGVVPATPIPGLLLMTLAAEELVRLDLPLVPWMLKFNVISGGENNELP